MESTTPLFAPRNSDDAFFRRRHNSTIAFAVGLLLFLLPFAELRCGSMTLMSNSGVGIAIGSEWKVMMGGNKVFDRVNSKVKDNEAKKTLSAGVNVFLLVAMAAAIFGIGLGFSDQKWRETGMMCAGILAVLMLVAMMVQLKIQMRAGLAESKDDKMEESIGQVLKMRFTIWYYISLLAFSCAAFFSFKKNKIEMQDAMMRFSEFEFQQSAAPPPFTPPAPGE